MSLLDIMVLVVLSTRVGPTEITKWTMMKCKKHDILVFVLEILQRNMIPCWIFLSLTEWNIMMHSYRRRQHWFRRDFNSSCRPECMYSCDDFKNRSDQNPSSPMSTSQRSRENPNLRRKNSHLWLPDRSYTHWPPSFACPWSFSCASFF